MSKMAALNDPSVVFYFFQKDIILLVSKIIWIKIKRLKFEYYALSVIPEKRITPKMMLKILYLCLISSI